ncbi:alpha-xylosidase 1 [Carex littledalei]|uniref:Alpha-xylosidase 1 n=1 Tax=Carex littledalei TaxID=544730 RepID=A0A833RMQ8_9POAL|nr:alpha-xylosidase 1 [Carex littledalei]
MAFSSPSLLFLGLLVSLCLSSGIALEEKIGYGYHLVSLEESTLHGGFLVGYLKMIKSTSKYGPDIPNLRLFVKHENQYRLRVHITDADSPRWEVPYNLLPRAQPPPLTKTPKISSHFSLPTYPGSNLIFTFQPDPFSFAVIRKSTGEIIFNTSGFDFVFKDQYIQISTQLPETASLYGLGETTQPGGIRLRPNDPYTLYTTDASAINLNTDLYRVPPSIHGFEKQWWKSVGAWGFVA